MFIITLCSPFVKPQPLAPTPCINILFSAKIAQTSCITCGFALLLKNTTALNRQCEGFVQSIGGVIMKKLISTVLALGMAAGLAGCGSSALG